MADAGIDIKIVSERLNRSSTNITREIDTHVTPPMQSDAAERVACLSSGTRSNSIRGFAGDFHRQAERIEVTSERSELH